MKKFLKIIVAVIMLATTVGCSKENINYEERLIKDSKDVIEEWGIVPDRTYSVTLDGDIYTVNINGNIQKVKVESFNDVSKAIYATEEVSDKKIISICNSAKEKIKKYIDTSTIIKDKDYVKQQIEGIRIMIADIDLDYAVAAYYEGTINIGKDYTEYVCEWMILHEYVHALAEITNEGIENEPYASTEFNEAMTDIITAYMEPAIKEEIESSYIFYYYDIMSYIGCFEEDAIYAYFYGYDELYEIVEKDEFDFFVLTFDNMFTSEFAEVCVNNFINKWGQK